MMRRIAGEREQRDEEHYCYEGSMPEPKVLATGVLTNGGERRVKRPKLREDREAERKGERDATHVECSRMNRIWDRNGEKRIVRAGPAHNEVKRATANAMQSRVTKRVLRPSNTIGVGAEQTEPGGHTDPNQDVSRACAEPGGRADPDQGANADAREQSLVVEPTRTRSRPHTRHPRCPPQKEGQGHVSSAMPMHAEEHGGSTDRGTDVFGEPGDQSDPDQGANADMRGQSLVVGPTQTRMPTHTRGPSQPRPREAKNDCGQLRVFINNPEAFRFNVLR